MFEYPTVAQQWAQVHLDDLWSQNKLFLSRMLGYNCGPFGTTVPKSDEYIIRPSINFMGMGRNARKRTMFAKDHKDDTYFEDYGMHPSDFWCEIFEGPHLSVDFHHKQSELVVFGERDSEDPYYKFKKWTKIDKKIEFPPILHSLSGNYEWINCEFIGDKLIEVQFRRNSDFKWNNIDAIPVWNGEMETIKRNLQRDYIFVEGRDYFREGLFISF